METTPQSTSLSTPESDQPVEAAVSEERRRNIGQGVLGRSESPLRSVGDAMMSGRMNVIMRISNDPHLSEAEKKKRLKRIDNMSSDC